MVELETNLKAQHNLSDARAFSILVRRPTGEFIASLVPVGPWILDSDGLIQVFSEWRGKAMKMFFSQFDSTADKTRDYLTRSAIADSQRILFAMEDSDSSIVGHIGVVFTSNSVAEIDNLMLGRSVKEKDFAFQCERELCKWVFEEFEIKEIHLRVFAFNFPAISLHKSVGFVESERVALRISQTAELTRYEECSQGESNTPLTSIRFTLSKELFQKSFIKS